MLSGACPRLVTVSVNTVELPRLCVPKSIAAGLKARVELAPDPVRLTACWASGVLSVIVRLPVLVPVWLGVKVTLTVQLAAGASVAGRWPQQLTWAKATLALRAERARDSFPQ